MNILYNTAIALYALGVKVASLRSSKVKKMLRGQRESITRLAARSGDLRGCVWFHAASLGEFEQGRPLIERLRREHPEKPILLTFFSPSGYEVRKNYPLADAVCYLPFDTPANVRRFIDSVEPSMAIFIKYEFWGNYLDELHRRNIPTFIISAIFRPGQIFFKPWGKYMRSVLHDYTRLYLQDARSAELLAGIGIRNTVVAGDTRFDRVTDVMKSRTDIPGFPGFARDFRHVFIAGSSWEADEERYIPWLKTNPSVAFIIAPHEFDDRRLELIRDQFAPGETMLLSEWCESAANGIPPHLNKIRGIIVDSFGKLSSLYRFSDIAYIGGGFGTGIHNINEAAVYGIPVVFGPNHSKFKEAADLIAAGGAFSVSSRHDFEKVVGNLFSSPDSLATAGNAAGAYIRRSIGATDRIYRDLFG